MGDEHLAQFLLLVGGAHDVEVDVDDLLYGDAVFPPHLDLREIRLEQLYEKPAHHVHCGIDIVGADLDADVGLADVLQGDHILVVIPAGEKGEKPLGMGFLEPLEFVCFPQELGSLRDIQQVVVEFIHHGVAVLLGKGKEVLQEARI